MQEDNFIKKILQNYISQTFITIFGIIGTIVTVYAFLQDKKVDLRYEIISNTNVLDFNAEINKLNVIYDSTNLRQTKENLRIYTIKVINNGDETLTNNFYDKNDPIGIKLSKGKIIEKPQIIETSNNYISRNLQIINYTKDQFNFSNIILERGEFYIVKFLVLHKKNINPTIISVGKIADQKNISIVNAIDVKNKEPFFEKVYFGSFWVQLLRLLTYFLLGIIITLIIAYLSSTFDTFTAKRRRKKLLQEFKKNEDYSYTKIDEPIFERFINNDYYELKDMHILLKDEEKLNNNYIKSKQESKNNKFRRIENRRKIVYNNQDSDIINKMIKDGILFKNEERLVINQPMKDTIDKLIEFLKRNNVFRQKNSLKFRSNFYYEDEI